MLLYSKQREIPYVVQFLQLKSPVQLLLKVMLPIPQAVHWSSCSSVRLKSVHPLDLFIHLSVHPSGCSLVKLFIRQTAVCSSVSPSVCSPVSPSVCSFVCLSVSPSSVCSSLSPSICLSLSLSICLPQSCLSVPQSTSWLVCVSICLLEFQSVMFCIPFPIPNTDDLIKAQACC